LTDGLTVIDVPGLVKTMVSRTLHIEYRMVEA